jgi:sugar phosphate permease
MRLREERMFMIRGRATRNFLLVLCIMYFILYVDRVNLAAAAGAIQKDLGLSNTELGIAFSAFNYSYASFQLVGGWIADRYGSRWTLAVCALVWALTTLLTGAVVGLVSLFAVRLVLGMGEGATLPAATRAMTRWMSGSLRGVAQGITHSASRLGAAVTAPVVAFLITWLSWRWSFVVLASLSALWAMLWLWYFRDDPREHSAHEPRRARDAARRSDAKDRRRAGAVAGAYPAHAADDDRLFLHGLDGLAVCHLDALAVPAQLRSRSEKLGVFRLWARFSPG